MNKTATKTALEAALDAAAPTSELWNAGLDAYKASQQENPGNEELAFNAALDAAAPDADSWNAGRNAAVLYGAHITPGSTRITRTRARLITEHNKKGDDHWTAKATLVFWFRMLIFGIGAIFFALLRPIVAVGYDDSYGAPWGIVATVVMFVFFALVFYAIGEGLIRSARKSARTTPTESATS